MRVLTVTLNNEIARHRHLRDCLILLFFQAACGGSLARQARQIKLHSPEVSSLLMSQSKSSGKGYTISDLSKNAKTT